MKRYQINFTDGGEPDSWRCNDYDHDHAEEKFWDFIEAEWGGPAGIRVTSVVQIKTVNRVNR